MNIKRPIILFVISAILGIVVAYDNVVISFKIIIVVTAIFLLFTLIIKSNIKFKYIYLLFFVFLVFIVRYKIEQNIYENCDKEINELAAKPVYVVGEIENIGSSKNSNYCILRDAILNDKKYRKIKLYYSKEESFNLKIGNVVKVKSNIYINKKPENEGEFNNSIYNRSNGIFFQGYIQNLELISNKTNKFKNLLYGIRLNIYEKINLLFVNEDAGLFYAMLLGDKSEINEVRKRLFNENGIAHILAISGLHLSILGICLFELLRKKFSLRVSAFIVSVFIFLYAILIDASLITLRAIIMLYIRFLSLSLGRTYDSKNSLYILCLIFLFLKPYLLFNAGFQFSYVSIFALNSDFTIKFINNDNDEKKLTKIPQTIVLTIFLMPITLYHYYTYPLYSYFLNLIIIPLMTFVILFGIIGVIYSYVSILIGRFFVGIVHFIFILYEKLCIIIERLPYNTISIGKPNINRILIFYMLIFLIWWFFREIDNIKKLKKVIFSILIFTVSIIILFNRKTNEYRMTFLSIGQGDSIVIENFNRIITIDGGSTTTKTSGEYILAPHLKSRGIDKIDTAFITHADSDHTNAILYVIKNTDIKFNNLILPVMAKNSEKYDIIKLAANEKNINILYKKAGDRIVFSDDLIIDVINPVEDDRDAINDINEQSLTFKMTYKNHSALFTGDIGKITEEKILKNNVFINMIKSDVLKVAHHGSKNSSLDEFIKYTAPSYSIISYGVNNKYGHPSENTINTLNKYHSKILKTAVNGQIDIFFKDNKINFKTFK